MKRLLLVFLLFAAACLCCCPLDSLRAQAADTTGLDSNILKQMLPMIAAVAMGAMSKKSSEGSSGIGDLLGSVAAIAAAAIILLTGWMPIDPLLSVLVALLILRGAVSVVRQSLHILLEGTPPEFEREALERALIELVPGVTGIHHIHVWSLSPEKPLLTMHVDVADMSDYKRTLLAINRVLSEDFGIQHATVQIETGRCVDTH